MPEEDGRALEEDVIQRLGEYFVAVQVADVEFEARADPGQRWIGELLTWSRRERLGGLEALEVLLEGQRGQNAPAACPFELAYGRHERTRRGLLSGVRHDLN